MYLPVDVAGAGLNSDAEDQDKDENDDNNTVALPQGTGKSTPPS